MTMSEKFTKGDCGHFCEACGEWPHTMDASVWAAKFADAVAADQTMTSDRGVMIGWFANAIMAGYDAAMLRARKLK